MPENTSPKQPGKHIVIDARIRRSSTGRYVDRLVEHLQHLESPHRYSVLVAPDDDWQPFAENFSRVEAPFAQFSFNPLQQIRFAALLYNLRADLVHFPMNQQPLLYFGRVITTTMDLTMLKFTRPGRAPLPIFWLKMAGYRLLFWYSNRRSKAIITISNYVQKELAKKYSFTATKTTTTYCASEPPLTNKAQKPAQLSTRDEFLLYVGAAFPHKNLGVLVDALPLLEARPNIKLVLVGKKEYYYEQLERYIASKDYADRIIVTGFVSDAELKWLYEHTTAYVFPSLSEGFGLPSLEAMVHGAPVVSSNASCLPEINGDAALYFNPTNLEDIALKIDRVIKDTELRKALIHKGYLQAKKYSWQRMAEQTLEVYERALYKK